MRLLLAIGALVPALYAPAFAAAAPETTACGLLTREEAAAVVGSAVAEGKPLAGHPMGPGIDIQNCTFEAPGQKRLSVSLWTFPPHAQGLEMYRTLCGKKEQAAGLGDLACWYSGEHRELQVLTGSRILTFELVGRRGAPAELIIAAKQALGRLK